MFSTCQASYTLNQSELSPLQILILDIRDARNLIEEGDNAAAIVILKSANKEIRKVKEFNSSTKKISSKRIKKGISLLKQNRNDEALALLQTAIDQLIAVGLADPGDFE
jgi:bifunctional N-acetylglucosamine-1-phosphate-uridyltransferase/glucosamine-1-phosphate-acetyltransferase GlmU-like protein